jgi:hypothetical protein
LNHKIQNDYCTQGGYYFCWLALYRVCINFDLLVSLTTSCNHNAIKDYNFIVHACEGLMQIVDLHPCETKDFDFITNLMVGIALSMHLCGSASPPFHQAAPPLYVKINY